MSYETFTNYEIHDIIQLETYMKIDNERLTNILNGMMYDYGTNHLTIFGKETFTETDISNLENAIATYQNPEVAKVEQVMNIGVQKLDIATEYFKTLFVYEYRPDPMWTLKKLQIKSICTLGSIDSSHTIRIVNVTTNIILGSGTFNNVELADNYITLDQIDSADKNTLEIQAKINNGTASILSAFLILESI